MLFKPIELPLLDISIVLTDIYPEDTSFTLSSNNLNSIGKFIDSLSASRDEPRLVIVLGGMIKSSRLKYLSLGPKILLIVPKIAEGETNKGLISNSTWSSNVFIKSLSKGLAVAA